jgi:mRNA interferase RelE/StbE
LVWTVRFEPHALRELSKLSRSVQERIIRFLQERIVGEHDPRDVGKPLTGDRVGLWRTASANTASSAGFRTRS